MRNIFLVAGICSMLAGCDQFDHTAYQKNPQALEKAMKRCATETEEINPCKAIKRFAYQLSYLGYQLQLNPQAFGLKVLTLQMTMASNHDPEALQRMQEDLGIYLTVIRWLESPEDSL